MSKLDCEDPMKESFPEVSSTLLKNFGTPLRDENLKEEDLAAEWSAKTKKVAQIIRSGNLKQVAASDASVRVASGPVSEGPSMHETFRTPSAFAGNGFSLKDAADGDARQDRNGFRPGLSPNGHFNPGLLGLQPDTRVPTPEERMASAKGPTAGFSLQASQSDERYPASMGGPVAASHKQTGRIGQLVQGALRAHAAQHNEGTMPATMPGTMPGMGKGSAMGSMLASGTLPSGSPSVGMSAGGRMPGILAGMEMSVKGSLLGKGIPAGKGSMPAGMESMPAGMESMPGIGTMPSALSVPAMVNNMQDRGHLQQAKEVISSLNCGDPAVMGRWMHHLEGSPHPMKEAERILAMIRTLVRQGFCGTDQAVQDRSGQARRPLTLQDVEARPHDGSGQWSLQTSSPHGPVSRGILATAPNASQAGREVHTTSPQAAQVGMVNQEMVRSLADKGLSDPRNPPLLSPGHDEMLSRLRQQKVGEMSRAFATEDRNRGIL